VTDAEPDTEAAAGTLASEDPEQIDEFARQLEEPPPPVGEEWEITRADTGGSQPMEGEAPTG